MGEYTSLYISGYDVLSTKTYPVPEIMTIFRESDKQIYKRKTLERLKIEFRGHQEVPLEEWEGANDDEIAYEYSNLVTVIKQRLDVMGFSLKKVKKQFEEAKNHKIYELEDQISYWGSGKNDQIYLQIQKEKLFELSVLENHSFDDWLQAYHEILTRGLELSNSWSNKKHSNERALMRYILDYSNGEIINNFPCYDIRAFLRALLEVCPDTSLIIQDFTRVVEAGYFEPDDPICQMSIELLIGEYPINEKFIVLTEGSTDKEFIEKSLALLYPHSHEYYAFMDFGISNASGGASSLVASLKSFIGSGIRNRIIALFDNDTAAYAALRGLKNITIPENIRVINYPDIEMAKYYPAMGPSGINYNNVNGLAASIELFFGDEVLKDEDGEFIPIQWKGYESKLQQYQGEITKKSELQKTFRKKLAMCTQNHSLIKETDWESMKQLLAAIFEAFS